MRDVSLNPARPREADTVTRAAAPLSWLDDPANAARLVTLSAGALRAVLAPDIGGALAAF
ncbi:hypothetical protein HDG40_005698 [Paraburkholderia sp. JPY158]|uniref:Uncharacterized protein n=1 Tax=Paraburkholderia atlantica TaxID=2654982 RepID=A0A7W8QC47_PARAM|nr:hypothetical protein [Paraburkholderia atlantica]